MSTTHEDLRASLERESFEPFVITTTDGRRIEVRRRDQALLNSQAISVVEAAFSVTVLGLHQVQEISRLD
jgi:hypothetical protein